MATEPYVMTVNGPIAPEALGITLVHEHLYMEFAGFGSEPTAPERTLDWASSRGSTVGHERVPREWSVHERRPDDLGAGLLLGGGWTVGRRPDAGRPEARPAHPARHLRAERTACRDGRGYFTEPFHDQRTTARTGDDLANEFLSEYPRRRGRHGHPARHHGRDRHRRPIHRSGAEDLRAYAWVQRDSGLAMSVHLQALGRNAPEVVDILTGEGVPPDRMSLCHMSPTIADEAYQLALFDRGVYLAYDYLGLDHAVYFPGRYMPNDYDVADAIARYVKRGLSSSTSCPTTSASSSDCGSTRAGASGTSSSTSCRCSAGWRSRRATSPRCSSPTRPSS